MKKKLIYRQQISRVSSVLLIVVFVFQIFTKAVYQHSHLLDNGRVITHSHPYNKSTDSTPFKHHQHSTSALFLFHLLEFLFPVFFAGILLLNSIQKFSLPELSVLFPDNENWQNCKGRSPPCLL